MFFELIPKFCYRASYLPRGYVARNGSEPHGKIDRSIGKSLLTTRNIDEMVQYEVFLHNIQVNFHFHYYDEHLKSIS